MFFLIHLIRRLLSSLVHRYGKENRDADRFGDVSEPDREPGIRWFLYVLKHFRGFAGFYGTLDPDSRSLMVQLICYRILGYRRVKLPTNTPEYWNQRKIARQFGQIAPDESAPTSGRWELPLADLNGIGYPMAINTSIVGIQTVFLQRHYEHRSRSEVVGARDGDHVIDAGACWGDTALFFAHEVGPEGRVYAFEFVSDNIDVLSRNLERNPGLGRRVRIIPHPLFSRSGVPLYYSSRGPSTHVTDERVSGTDVEVDTVSLDDLVARGEIPRVDLIKMDIEGAELEALKGAEETIRRFRPRLAISLYHKKSDFVEIPSYLQHLVPDYRFSLGHYTIHSEETVLFATT